MNIVDSHCHLTDKRFDKDREEVVKRSMEKLKAVITVGIDPKDNETALGLAKKHPDFVFPTLGCFPTDCYDQKNLDKVFEQVKNNKCIAVGEVGLDYHWEQNPNKRDLQRKAFSQFIDLAKDQNLPLVVHTRNAMQDTFKLLEKDPPNTIIHCFSGSVEDAKKCEENGFFVSLATNQIPGGRTLINKLNPNNILVETDSPFLWKGARNEPSNVVELVSFISIVKELSVEECADIIYENTLRAYPGLSSIR